MGVQGVAVCGGIDCGSFSGGVFSASNPLCQHPSVWWNNHQRYCRTPRSRELPGSCGAPSGEKSFPWVSSLPGRTRFHDPTCAGNALHEVTGPPSPC